MSPRIASASILVALLVVPGCAVCGKRTVAGPERLVRGTAAIEMLPGPESPPPPEGYKPENLSPQMTPETVNRTPPRYPDSALADEVACTAKILFHVETDGSATLVRLEWVLPPPEAHRPAFAAEIREAIGDWEFKPAVRFNRKEDPDGRVRYVPQTIPKALYAELRFRVVEGAGIVE